MTQDISFEEIAKKLSRINVSDDLGRIEKYKPKELSPMQLRQMAILLDELEKRKDYSGVHKWFVDDTPYSLENLPRHKAFFDAGKTRRQRLFMAGNRSGKTIAGAYELACHAIGWYPRLWDGRRFSRPISGWAVGPTGQSTRDVLQKELLGPPGAMGTGMIPAENIVRTAAKQGIAGAVDFIDVRHSSGGVSTIGFKSYDQDIKAFGGVAKDVVWMDEECPELIYNECLIRTASTGGIIYVTFTPQHGLTPFVINFCKTADFLAGSVPFILPEEDNEQ